MTKEEAIQILSTRDAHGVLCGYTSGVTEALDMAIESLSVEEIVRCKDCRYAEHREQMPNQVYCKRDKLSTFCAVHDDDDFCKYGERREP